MTDSALLNLRGRLQPTFDDK